MAVSQCTEGTGPTGFPLTASDTATAPSVAIPAAPANQFLSAATALIDRYALTPTGSDEREDVSVAFYEDLPLLTDIGVQEAVCAGFARALFGKEVVPNFEPETWGGHAHMAFKIACVYLMAERRGDAAAVDALLCLAVAVHQRGGEESACAAADAEDR